jgi:hypothetical protein
MIILNNNNDNNNSSEYKGCFKDGMYNGHGEMICSDGSKYTGEW